MSKLESDLAKFDKKLHGSGRKTKGNWGMFKKQKSGRNLSKNRVSRFMKTKEGRKKAINRPVW